MRRRVGGGYNQPGCTLVVAIGEQTVNAHGDTGSTVALEEHLIHHPPAVRQVRDGLRDHQRSTHAALVIDPELQKDIIVDPLHNVPVRRDAGILLEGGPDLTTRRRVGICIVAHIGTVFVVFSVFELGHDRGHEKSRVLVEGEAGFDRMGACNICASACVPPSKIESIFAYHCLLRSHSRPE